MKITKFNYSRKEERNLKSSWFPLSLPTNFPHPAPDFRRSIWARVGIGSHGMAAKQMEEVQKKLAMLNYSRANAPAQSLLFAGMERYALLEWLFFKYGSIEVSILLCEFCYWILITNTSIGFADYWAINLLFRSKIYRERLWIETKRPPGYNVVIFLWTTFKPFYLLVSYSLNFKLSALFPDWMRLQFLRVCFKVSASFFLSDINLMVAVVVIVSRWTTLQNWNCPATSAAFGVYFLWDLWISSWSIFYMRFTL